MEYKCDICDRIMKSQAQLEFHYKSKKHTNMVVKSTLYDNKNVTTPDEVVIQKFRSQGVSIPIGIRHVIYVSKKVDFSDALTEITTSAILVENEIVVAIIDFDFFSNELKNILTSECSILYTAGGIVERGKKKSGGDMVIFGWRNSRNDGFDIYKQTNRKGTEKNMKISAVDLNTLSARTTSRVFDVLNTQMSSWIKNLENLIPKELGILWGRIGNTPFTTMSVTKNYWSPDHIDDKDGGSGFIFWVHKGNFQSQNLF
jgi:hypothetical protein